MGEDGSGSQGDGAWGRAEESSEWSLSWHLGPRRAWLEARVPFNLICVREAGCGRPLAGGVPDPTMPLWDALGENPPDPGSGTVAPTAALAPLGAEFTAAALTLLQIPPWPL